MQQVLLALPSAILTILGLVSKDKRVLWPSLFLVGVLVVSRWLNSERFHRRPAPDGAEEAQGSIQQAEADGGTVDPEECGALSEDLVKCTRAQVVLLVPVAVVGSSMLTYDWAALAALPVIGIAGSLLGILEFYVQRAARVLGVTWIAIGRKEALRVDPGTAASTVATTLFLAALLLVVATGFKEGSAEWAGDGTEGNEAGPRQRPPSPEPRETFSTAEVYRDAPGLGPLSETDPPPDDPRDSIGGISCPRDHELLASTGDPNLDGQIWAAYSHFGSGEIGCPADRVEVNGDLYVARLVGGDSERALVVSDSLGNANVVFAKLVSRVRHFIRAGLLERVTFRWTTGYGDLQVLHLEGGACAYSERREYGADYIHLGPAASALVIAEATELKMFPSLFAEKGRRVEVHFRGMDPEDDEGRTLVSRGGEAWWKDDSSVRTRRDTPCGDVDLLESLAKQQEVREERLSR